MLIRSSNDCFYVVEDCNSLIGWRGCIRSVRVSSGASGVTHLLDGIPHSYWQSDSPRGKVCLFHIFFMLMVKQLLISFSLYY